MREASDAAIAELIIYKGALDHKQVEDLMEYFKFKYYAELPPEPPIIGPTESKTKRRLQRSGRVADAGSSASIKDGSSAGDTSAVTGF